MLQSEVVGLDLLLRAVRRLDSQTKRTLAREHASTTLSEGGTRWLRLPQYTEPDASSYTFG